VKEKNQLKLFTVQEANRLLPELEKLVRELRQKRNLIASLEVEIDLLEILSPKDDSDAASSPVFNKKVEDYQKLVDHFYGLIDKIHAAGCFLKDIDMGLLDFYTLYQGRVVYLCWRLGEKEITTWHEIGRGYSYRQPIELGRGESGFPDKTP
jgi:hypothetical protein